MGVSVLRAALVMAVAVSVAPAAGGASTTRCTEAGAIALAREFAARLTAGRAAAAERLWAREPRFYWYSAGSPGRRLGAAAYRRSTLLAYLRARTRLHERLRIVEVHAGLDAARGLVHFSGKLVRAADDTRPRLREFKGAVDCDPGGPLLVVWSM